VALIFKYCDDNGLPLLDLKDFIKVLQYISAEGKAEIEKTYGKISTTSTGTILRKVIELQQQGADLFFGERSFDVDDLMRIADDGRGSNFYITCNGTAGPAETFLHLYAATIGRTVCNGAGRRRPG
jgi:DNA helicase HerA-like ATPase